MDLVGLIREPLSSSQSDWHDDVGTFDVFARDEARVDALVKDQPVLYARLQATLADPWAGGGYERLRGILGSQVIENT